jgi:chromosomal replication initiator protein
MLTLWQEFLKIVHEEVGSRVVETWFKAVQLAKWDAPCKTVYLEAPNKFVKDWISTHYMTILELHLARLFNEDTITIIISEHGTADTHVHIPSSNATEQKLFTPARKIEKKSSTPALQLPKRAASLVDKYTFDTFIVGPTNKLAFAAAHAASEKPGILYNPLFIYGESGLGKTHLLHAIGNHIRLSNRQVQVLYLSAHQFIKEFIQAIRFDKMTQFESRFSNVDVLLVDDIQCISHKEQTQEAFFNIFNLLYQNHKQIVFTSDCLPSDLQGLANRIKSRLNSGLVADIKMPDYETRIAILKAKADLMAINVDDSTFEFIASVPFTNIRELEAALTKVHAYAEIHHCIIDEQLAKQVLQAENKISASTPQTNTKILKLIANHFHKSINDLKSSSKDRTTSYARHVGMYCLKKISNTSLKEIGNLFNRKDHTTVLHAIQKIERERLKDEELNAFITSIMKEITQFPSSR